MPDVEKTNTGKIILTCDCGAEHVLTKDKESGDITIKSKYVAPAKDEQIEKEKKEKEKKDGEIKTGKKYPDIFDDDDES
jgi:hypothetical protein